MEQVKIGVIGGSGLYQIEQLTDINEIDVDTPFGKPSDSFIIGTFGGERIAFLARHGRGHRIMPTELNARANIYAMKLLGVEHLISVSACGSLREDYEPRHIVVPDQLFDFTKKRNYSFFGDGLVAHPAFADPFCPDLSQLVADALKKAGAAVHQGATYIAIEGPRFSTRAESNVYRKWGMDIIGMTAFPEAILAREAEICYAMMACITDYDCWHEEAEDVTVEVVIANLMANAEISKKALLNLIPTISKSRECACQNAMETSFITQRELIGEGLKAKLKPLIQKYID